MRCGGRRGRARHFEPRIGLAFARRALGPERVRTPPLVVADAPAAATPGGPGADGTGNRAAAPGSRRQPHPPIAAPARPAVAARHDAWPAGRSATAAPPPPRPPARPCPAAGCSSAGVRWPKPTPRRPGLRRRPATGTGTGAGSTSLTTSLTGSRATTSAGGAGTSIRAGRAVAVCAESWDPFSAALTRASSVTTADRPTSRSPPTTREGARQNQRTAQAQLFDRDAESDQCSACGSQQYTQH